LLGFWTLFIIQYSKKAKKAKNMTFRKLDLLLSSGEAKEGEGGMTRPAQLGLLERASLNHWMEASFFSFLEY
jgi:hypothetical protein